MTIVKTPKAPDLICGTPRKRVAQHARRLQRKLAMIDRRERRRAKGFVRWVNV